MNIDKRKWMDNEIKNVFEKMLIAEWSNNVERNKFTELLENAAVKVGIDLYALQQKILKEKETKIDVSWCDSYIAEAKEIIKTME